MRPHVLAAFLAFAITVAYAAALQPDWEPTFNDQQQYLALARGLVDRSEFTRATTAEPFIPETLRLPGYPLLIAPLCLDRCDHWRIAIAQGLAFAALVLAAYALARRLASPRVATLAAFLIALFLPFGYWGAFALSDLPGALLTLVAVALWTYALTSGRRIAAGGAGALFGYAVLMRASLALLPVTLAAVALAQDRRTTRLAVACLAGVAIVVAPYITYSELNFGRPTGGNGGAVLWIGALQGRTEGSLDAFEHAQVDAARAEIAAFDAIDDRVARARAWPALDGTLGSRARQLIAHDPAGWTARGAVRSFELWAGDRPAPDGMSGDAALGFAALELALTAIGMFGVMRLAREGTIVSAIPLVIVAYVWLSALPFGTESRYALPARVFLLIGVASLLAPASTRTSRGAADGTPRPRAA